MKRDLKTPFFKHILCSFAMDRYIIEMSAHLSGKDTKFLPFNKGFNGGAGNRPATEEDLYPTDYFYNEIMTRESITTLIQYFIFNDENSMIFPRYHQYECTNNIITDVKENLKENKLVNYLVSASTGSGKSNMISWTAYRLAYLNDENNKSIFDGVIVVSNRLQINRNLTSTIKGMPHQDNFIIAPQTSSQLQKAINNGSGRIILTNIQKFPWVVDGVHSTAGKKFAVLIDEGHDSTSGEYIDDAKSSFNAEEVKSLKELINKENFTSEDIADLLLSRKKKSEGKMDNVTFMAFTGTPKGETKVTFGIKEVLKDGREEYKPFYSYTMKQAIEEGFILDPLQNYTTYKTYCNAKCISNNEDIVQAANATKALNIAKLLDPDIIWEKANIALDFYEKKAGELNGNSKMMIVCNRREQVMTYYDALKTAIDAAERDWEVLVEFSGPLQYNGRTITENDINNLPEGKPIEKVFHENKNYRILVVADKFTVGFDEPYLTTMTVDDSLNGVRAVQTLSRLNRICNGFDKHTAVLDFVNSYDDIVKAFDPYYSDAHYYRVDKEEALETLVKYVDDLGLIDYETLVKASKLLLSSKYISDEEGWASLSAIVKTVIDKIDKMSEDWAPSDVYKQAEKRKSIVWTIRRFVRYYELKSQVDQISNDEYLNKHVFYSHLLLCIKNGGAPSVIDVRRAVKFINIVIDHRTDYNNPNYSDGVEITSTPGSLRGKKPNEVITKTLEQVVEDFNKEMGLSPENTLFYEVLSFLETNELVKTALLQFDNFEDFEKKISDNATKFACNVYKVITKSEAYPILSANPNFNWKNDLLDTALIIIWHNNKCDA